MTITRISAGVIALIAWIGLGAQFFATLSTTGSVATALWLMFLYFTIIANFAAAVIFTAIAGNAKWPSPFVIGGITITMLLVGIVYNTMLTGMIELSGGAKLADFLNHTITPITVSAFWLFLAGKGRLGFGAPIRWASVPLGYFVYGLIRGAKEGTYPYPFMNLGRLGWRPTLLNALGMAICFLVVGYVMIWLDQRLSRVRDRQTS